MSGTDGSRNPMTQKGEMQVELALPSGVRKVDSVARRMAAYQSGLLVLGVVLLVLALPRGLGNPFAVLGLAAIAALAERGRVGLASSTEVSISVLPTVFAAA